MSRIDFKNKNDKNIVFLIVDDIPNMRRTLRNMLKHLGYKNIFETENGRAALAKVKVQPINFIITDINMPIINGIEFIKVIRKDPKLKFIPIIVITGETDKNSIANAAEVGADEYLIKPFFVTTLETKIKSTIDSLINPEKSHYHYIKGVQYYDNNQFVEALDEFKESVKIDKKFSKAYSGMANIFIKNNQIDKAEMVINESLKHNPNYIEAYQILGDIYKTKKDIKTAIQYFQKAYSLNPKNLERIINLAQINIEISNKNEADKYLKIALNTDNTQETKNKIADIYLESGNYDKAIEIYGKIVQENPVYLLAYNKMGIAYRKQQKFDEAIESYKKAVTYGGEDKNVYYNMSRTYYEKGDIEKAATFAEKALKIDPDFIEAKEVLAVFKKNIKP